MSKFSVPLYNPKKAAPDMTTDIMSGVELAKGGKKGEPTEEGMSDHLDQLNRYQASLTDEIHQLMMQFRV